MSEEQDLFHVELSRRLLARPPEYFNHLTLDTPMGEGFENLRAARFEKAEEDEAPILTDQLRAWEVDAPLLPIYAFDDPESSDDLEIELCLGMVPREFGLFQGLEIDRYDAYIDLGLVADAANVDPATHAMGALEDIPDIAHHRDFFNIRVTHANGYWLPLERKQPEVKKEDRQLFVARVAMFVVHKTEPLLLPIVFNIDGTEVGYIPQEVSLLSPWLYQRAYARE